MQDQVVDAAMAREIQASDAKTHLPQLLDDVERGETIIITRHGRPIARIVPESHLRQQEIDKAIEDGYLNPHWLDCPHPVIGLGSKDVMFGDHVGINPETPDAAWAFQFELVPTEAAKLSGVGRR